MDLWLPPSSDSSPMLRAELNTEAPWGTLRGSTAPLEVRDTPSLLPVWAEFRDAKPAAGSCSLLPKEEEEEEEAAALLLLLPKEVREVDNGRLRREAALEEVEAADEMEPLPLPTRECVGWSTALLAAPPASVAVKAAMELLLSPIGAPVDT